MSTAEDECLTRSSTGRSWSSCTALMILCIALYRAMSSHRATALLNQVWWHINSAVEGEVEKEGLISLPNLEGMEEVFLVLVVDSKAIVLLLFEFFLLLPLLLLLR